MSYDELFGEFTTLKKGFADKQSHDVAKKFDLPALSIPACKRTLKNIHISTKITKIYGVAWNEDGTKLVSVGQDNTMMVTDPVLNLKAILPVKLSYGAGMACAMQGKLVACGGMDNMVTIYDTSTPADVKKKKQLDAHEGYIAGLSFIDASKLLSSSGDSFAKLWDLSTGQCVTTFSGHIGDTSGLSRVPTAPNIFATSSTDKTTRIWDLNTGKCVRIFEAKYGCNCVAMHPSGCGVMSGCDNASWEVYDIGSYSQMARGKVKKGRCEAVAFSASGRFSYLGWDTAELVVADTYVPSEFKAIKKPDVPDAHEDTVCSLAMSPDGSALASSAYDGLIKIWGGA